jgi:hypothetical protein
LLQNFGIMIFSLPLAEIGQYRGAFFADENTIAIP